MARLAQARHDRALTSCCQYDRLELTIPEPAARSPNFFCWLVTRQSSPNVGHFLALDGFGTVRTRNAREVLHGEGRLARVIELTIESEFRLDALRLLVRMRSQH